MMHEQNQSSPLPDFMKNRATGAKKTRRQATRLIPNDIREVYAAITKYVRNRGGKLIVVGGIEIQEWPNDPKLVFRVGIRCMGRKPSLSPDAKSTKASKRKKKMKCASLETVKKE